MSYRPRIDKYGRAWRLPLYELCDECGQPDNCGDCTHGQLTVEDVRQLGGRPTDKIELAEFQKLV